MDWQSIFAPTLGLAEVVLRGSIMYLALFAILRFLARRQAGNFGPADLLVIVLIADAAQNALGKDYNSITEGLALVLTIVAWDYALDWVAWRYPRLRRILHAAPLQLVDKGKILDRNLAREMLTREELLGQLREEGVDDVSKVRAAYLEGDGRFSVLKDR
jgi:uncharacterized membrane protein YcaP (DUF421 family)